jgi:NADPH:quinone reductase-like Zn-dependent oxidoreductase
MKAIVYHEYGTPDVLELQEIEKPAVKDEEVLIRVHATSVNPADWHLMTGKPYVMRPTTGLSKPKNQLLGLDMAGRVDAVGRNVTRFQPGDEVFGAHDGAYAEYAAAPEGLIALKPANLTYEEAAAVPVAGLTALQGLRDKGHVRSGQKVLIIGASGGVGTFAVQLAKSFGAEVTGVCSTRNLDRVRSLGADRVIDYTREDFTRSGQRYDLIFQVAGTVPPSACRRVLSPAGTLVLCSGEGGSWLGPIGRILSGVVGSSFSSQKVVMWISQASHDDLVTLKELIEAGTVTPVIDRRYALAEAAEALRYQGEGHTQGKIVITVP